MNLTSVYKIGKQKIATKAGGGVQWDTAPTLSFCGGELEDTTHNLLEDVTLQVVVSPRSPFRFTQSSRSPFI